jgi:hypothetical protein
MNNKIIPSLIWLYHADFSRMKTETVEMFQVKTGNNYIFKKNDFLQEMLIHLVFIFKYVQIQKKPANFDHMMNRKK